MKYSLLICFLLALTGVANSKEMTNGLANKVIQEQTKSATKDIKLTTLNQKLTEPDPVKTLQIKQPYKHLDKKKKHLSSPNINQLPHDEIQKKVARPDVIHPTNKTYWGEIITFIFALAVVAFSLGITAFLNTEKERIKAANKWILEVVAANMHLVSIKKNYVDKLVDHPFPRISNVPVIKNNHGSIQADISDIVFVMPANWNVGQVSDEEYDKAPFGEKIIAILAMKEQYHQILRLWEARNSEFESFNNKLKDKKIFGRTIDEFDLYSSMYLNDIQNVSFLTENVLKKTDDLIIDMYDFLDTFPGIVGKKLRIKRFRNFWIGTLVHPTYNPQKVLKDKEKCNPVMEYEYRKIQDASPEEIQNYLINEYHRRHKEFLETEKLQRIMVDNIVKIINPEFFLQCHS